MSAWRKRALEAFPDLRNELQAPDATIYSAFFELVPMCIDAYREANTAKLKLIFNFAVWCSRQKERELWNAAGVAFFEKIAIHKGLVEDLPKWVPKDVFENMASLLEDAVGQVGMDALRKHYSVRAR